MIHSVDFLKKVVDSVPEHIAVLNKRGAILFTNRAWNTFGQENGCPANRDWSTTNYLDICDSAAGMGDEYGRSASEGIRKVINNDSATFSFEYPCHGPAQKRWFTLNASGLAHRKGRYVVITHVDITNRKLAEEQVQNLSRVDGLTGLFNRRHFDVFLREEWRRCIRLGLPITLVFIDIDHFKILNKTYGHQYGDDCLVEISNILGGYAQRPGDIAARYGGEELALVFANATKESILPRILNLKTRIEQLGLPNRASPVSSHLTVSMGVATMVPARGTNQELLLRQANMLLFRAKANGRDRVEY